MSTKISWTILQAFLFSIITTTFNSSLSKQMAWALPLSFNIHRQVVSPPAIHPAKISFVKGMIMRFSSTDTSSQLESSAEQNSNEALSIQNSDDENLGWRTINNWDCPNAVTEPSTKDITSTSPSSLFADYTDLKPTFTTSPIEKCIVRDRILYLKRDDLLRLPDSNISGNKARKLYALNGIPAHSFPKLIISYGGSQSNAMLALAAIVNSKNYQNYNNGQNRNSSSKLNSSSNSNEQGESNDKNEKKYKFLNYTKKLPRWLRKTPSGSFLRAKSLGMEIVELSPTMYE